jgi:hypothetical protein
MLASSGEGDLVKSKEKELEEESAAKAAADKIKEEADLRKRLQEEALETERRERETARLAREAELAAERLRRETERNLEAERRRAADAQRMQEEAERLRQQFRPPPPPGPQPGAFSPRSSASSAPTRSAPPIQGFAMLIGFGVLALLFMLATALAAGGLKMASHVIFPSRPLDYPSAFQLSLTCNLFGLGCGVVAFLIKLACREMPEVGLLITAPIALTNLLFPPYHYSETLEISILAAVGLWLVQLVCTVIIMWLLVVVLVFVVPAILMPLSFMF